MSVRKRIDMYTDGACLGNPGPGGYGVVLEYGPHSRELQGGFHLTTNNRMELIGPIEGLTALKEPCSVTLYSDSKYVVDAMSQGWAKRWRANRWMRNKREKTVNPDLWGRLLSLCEKHDVEFRWVKGHSGIPQNERCDELAVEASRKDNLPDDLGYSPDNHPGKDPQII